MKLSKRNFLWIKSSKYNDKGVSLIDLQRYDEAIKCFDKIIDINPNKIEAFNNKGNLINSLKVWINLNRN